LTKITSKPHPNSRPWVYTQGTTW